MKIAGIIPKRSRIRISNDVAAEGDARTIAQRFPNKNYFEIKFSVALVVDVVRTIFCNKFIKP